MIIDFHTHTFPDKIAPQALHRLQSMSHNALFSDGTVQGLTDSMAIGGVTHSVVLPVVTNPEKTVHINDLSISYIGDEKLIYFGGMHPDFPGYQQELARLQAAGIKGIKLHPLHQGTDITDPRYLKILECCGELGLIVLIHAGADPSFPGQERCTPKMIRQALDLVGPVTLIAAHMGSLMYWDSVPEYLLDTNVYLDTAFSLGKMAQTEEHFYDEVELQLLAESRFCQLIDLFSKERILFGTDSPWNRQIYVRRQIDALPLPQETKDYIYYKNACRLLNIKENITKES